MRSKASDAAKDYAEKKKLALERATKLRAERRTRGNHPAEPERFLAFSKLLYPTC